MLQWKYKNLKIVHTEDYTLASYFFSKHKHEPHSLPQTLTQVFFQAWQNTSTTGPQSSKVDISTRTFTPCSVVSIFCHKTCYSFCSCFLRNCLWRRLRSLHYVREPSPSLLQAAIIRLYLFQNVHKSTYIEASNQ